MQRIIFAAAVLLIFQIVLIFYSNITSKSYEAYSPEVNLFTLSPESVSSLTFIDGDKQELTLIKNDGSWHIAEFQTVPASEILIKELLEKLANFKQGLALATSQEAAKRFKVSDELFEHHLIIKQGDDVVADLYAGTSSGLRQVYARVAGQDKIIHLPLSALDLDPKVESWIDKQMLQVKEDHLKGIKMESYSIDKNDAEWQLAEAGEMQQTNREEVKKLIDKLTGLTIQTVLDAEEVTESETGEPYLRYSLIEEDKGEITFSFTKPEGEFYILKVSGREHYFKVNKRVVDEIKAISRESLIMEIQAEEQREEKEDRTEK